MDLRTLSGGMPAPSPIAMLESNSARNACSFTTRIRKRSSESEARVSRMRNAPFSGMSGHCTSLLYALENAGRALTAAHAHRDHPVLRPAACHLAQNRGRQLGAGAPERMSQRDRAAIQIDTLRVQPR